MSSEADQASRMRDDACNPRNGIDGKLACITKCLKNGDGGLARASPLPAVRRGSLPDCP